MKAPVSACVIARDEADEIVACIASLTPFLQDVVVLDTGSRDATIDLATAAGARAFTFGWSDSFAEARNTAIQHATQPYILMVDADERLESDSVPALLAYCAAQPTVAGRVRQVNIGVGAEHEQVEVPLTRLFPNDPDYRYTGRVHEQLTYRDAEVRSISTEIRLLHTGYTPSAIADRGKLERNIVLLERALSDAPDDPYLLFQLGRTQALGGRDADAALRFDSALSMIAERDEKPVYLPSLLLESAYSAIRLSNTASAVGLVELGLELFPDFTDLYFAYGMLLLEIGDAARLDDVRLAFEACLTLGEADSGRYETHRGVGSFRAQYNLGLYAELTGDRPAAREYLAQAAAAGFEPAARRLASLGDGL